MIFGRHRTLALSPETASMLETALPGQRAWSWFGARSRSAEIVLVPHSNRPSAPLDPVEAATVGDKGPVPGPRSSGIMEFRPEGGVTVYPSDNRLIALSAPEQSVEDTAVFCPPIRRLSCMQFQPGGGMPVGGFGVTDREASALASAYSVAAVLRSARIGPRFFSSFVSDHPDSSSRLLLYPEQNKPVSRVLLVGTHTGHCCGLGPCPSGASCHHRDRVSQWRLLRCSVMTLMGLQWFWVDGPEDATGRRQDRPGLRTHAPKNRLTIQSDGQATWFRLLGGDVN